MSARCRATLALVAIALAVGETARAQVGHTPDASPFRDLDHKHELTGFAGYLRSQTDPAGVAWRGGPMVGARYELHLGGPGYLVGRVAAVQSQRTVKDPAKPLTQRVVEERNGQLLLADVGLTLSLTGHKTWHGLSPVVTGGGGVATDFRGTDAGGFRFGTPFALTFGGGVRWAPGGRLQGRIDLTDYLYRISYPERFYRETEGIPVLIDRNVARSRWTHNAALTVGVSYLFGR